MFAEVFVFNNKAWMQNGVKKSHNGHLVLFIVIGKSRNSRSFNVSDNSGARGAQLLM